MAKNEDLALVAGDFIAHAAVLGTTAPTALTGVPATDALDTPWIDLGWMDDGDGMVSARALSNTNLTGYGQRAPLRTILTSEVETFKLTPLETSNPGVLDLWAGNAPGTTTPSAAGLTTITTGSGTYPKFALVLDGFDGDTEIRIYIPAATVTDVGDETWKQDAFVSRGLTVTATVGSDGVAVSRSIFNAAQASA